MFVKDTADQWRSTRVRQCTQVRLESIFLKLILGLRCKGLGPDSSPQDSDSDSVHYRPMMLSHYFLHWDSMFKKIQWTFSIYFLNSNYLLLFSVPTLQYQCMFLWRVLWAQSVAVSRLHMSQTDIEVTDCTCKLQLLHASWTGVQQWRNVHVATHGRTLEQVELWFSLPLP